MALIIPAGESPEQIRARTGLSKSQVQGALHVLKKRGKIVLTAYGRYAEAGTASPHIYTKHLIVDALLSDRRFRAFPR